MVIDRKLSVKDMEKLNKVRTVSGVVSSRDVGKQRFKWIDNRAVGKYVEKIMTSICPLCIYPSIKDQSFATREVEQPKI